MSQVREKPSKEIGTCLITSHYDWVGRSTLETTGSHGARHMRGKNFNGNFSFDLFFLPRFDD